MIWQTPKEVTEYFGLTVDDESPEAVRKAIRRRIAEIHPDSNAGKTDETLLRQLTSAKEFLEHYQEDSKALIPISQLPALIQALSVATARSSDQTPVDRVRESTRNEIRRDVFLPRIGSGVFAAICTFLFAFPKTVKDNPLLDRWLSTHVSQNVLLCALLYSAAVFILTWIGERSEEARIEWLMTEAGLEDSLRRLCQNRFGLEDSPITFGVRDLARLHSHMSRHRSPFTMLFRTLLAFVFLPFGLRYTVAEKVARGQLEALLQQGLVREVPRTRFGRTYELVGRPFDGA